MDELKELLKDLIDKCEITLVGCNITYTTKAEEFPEILEKHGKVFTLHVKVKRGDA